MIWESDIWKTELYKNSIIIANATNLKRYRESTFARIEKAIMLSCFIIRKLNEAQKIQSDFFDNIVQVEVYKLKEATLINHMNWHNIDEHYCMSKSINQDMKWAYLINQIIHSFVFIIGLDDNVKFTHFYFNSDRTKRNRLFKISIYDFLKLILLISEGGIFSLSRQRDDKSNWSIKSKYAYLPSFDIEQVIKNIKEGHIYKRS